MSFTSGKIYNPYTMAWESSEEFFKFMETTMTEPKSPETTEEQDVMDEMVENEGDDTTEDSDTEEEETEVEEDKK